VEHHAEFRRREDRSHFLPPFFFTAGFFAAGFGADFAFGFTGATFTPIFCLEAAAAALETGTF
jgi:hypothetical protein